MAGMTRAKKPVQVFRLPMGKDSLSQCCTILNPLRTVFQFLQLRLRKPMNSQKLRGNKSSFDVLLFCNDANASIVLYPLSFHPAATGETNLFGNCWGHRLSYRNWSKCNAPESCFKKYNLRHDHPIRQSYKMLSFPIPGLSSFSHVKSLS